MSRMTQASVTAGVALALACASLSGPATASTPQLSSAVPQTAAATRSDDLNDKSFTPKVRAEALKTAQAKAASVAKSLGLTGPQKLRATDVERDSDGTLHVRYNRTLGGLPVMGGDFVVHRAANGKIRSADFATNQPLVLNTKLATKVSSARASQLAAKAAAGKAGTAHKIVWAVDGIPRVAWRTTVVSHDKNGNPIPKAVVVDARTGRTIQKWHLNQTADGDGHSLYSGDVTIKTKPQGGGFVLRDGYARQLTDRRRVQRRRPGRDDVPARRRSSATPTTSGATAPPPTGRRPQSTRLTGQPKRGTSTKTPSTETVSPTTATAPRAGSTTATATPMRSGTTAASA